MSGEDEEHTAFIIVDFLFCYVSMPYGLKNALPTFVHAMHKTFEDPIRDLIEVYVDDIVVKIKSHSSLLDNLAIVFDRLCSTCTMLNPDKCLSRVSARKLLGFLISHQGIEANPEKIKAIEVMRLPASRISRSSREAWLRSSGSSLDWQSGLSHSSNFYGILDPQLVAYLLHAQKMETDFEFLDLQHVPHANNAVIDVLSIKASTWAPMLDGVFERQLQQPTTWPTEPGREGETSTSKLVDPTTLLSWSPPRIRSITGDSVNPDAQDPDVQAGPDAWITEI
jgi:hypothetical protein